MFLCLLDGVVGGVVGGVVLIGCPTDQVSGESRPDSVTIK